MRAFSTQSIMGIFLDYRRPLFQLEQWSPFLAKKIWGLTSLLESPIALALGFKVSQLTDSHSEIVVSLNPLNQDAGKGFKPAVILAAGEFAAKILWHRHLDPRFDQLTLHSMHCRFLKAAFEKVKVRTEMNEVEKERFLRKARQGESVDGSAEYDMPVLVLDSCEQQVASINCVWKLKTLRPVTLGAGKV